MDKQDHGCNERGKVGRLASKIGSAGNSHAADRTEIMRKEDNARVMDGP